MMSNILSILNSFLPKCTDFWSRVSCFGKASRVVANEKGQGGLEYVLLLFIVVTLLVGGVYQFNDAFNLYAKNYFGEYLQCLLETGELPALSSDEEGICNESFQAFSLANGRPPAKGAGGSANGGSSVSQNEAGGRNNTVTQNGRSANGSSPNSGGTRATNLNRVRTSNSGNPFGSNDGLRRSRFSAGGSRDGGASGKKAKIPTNFKADTYTDLGSSESSSLRPRVARVRGQGNDDDEDSEEKKLGRAGVGASANDPGRTQKVPVGKKKVRTPATVEENLGIGGFLRYLVIAAMIIAVLLFIGGQLQSVGKSLE